MGVRGLEEEEAQVMIKGILCIAQECELSPEQYREQEKT